MQALINLRRELHRYPEASGQELQTARRVLDFLQRHKPNQVWTGMGGHGLVALYDSKQSGPCILLRAELDALPIQEVNDFPHRSKYEGHSHKCGHDGHTSILLGLAETLSRNPLRRGKVLLVFQPAEETGAGAKAMLGDPQWATIPKPDFAFALHNLPAYPLGQVLIREGAITAAVRSMIIRLYGKTAHAAEPEKGHNPSTVLSLLLPQLEELSNNEVSRDDFKVITPVYIQLGEQAYGVSAGYAELHLTIRSWTEMVMEELIAEIKQLLANACQQAGIRFEIDWTDVFLGNTNQAEATERIIRAARRRGLKTLISPSPLKWGEDFGYFTQQYPGAFFGLGAGEDTPSLHHPDYDFPDELIEIGVNIWVALLRELDVL